MSAAVEAILEKSRDWLTAATGRAVRVVDGEGQLVVFEEELAPGRWGDPERLTAEAFLRHHVLAAGVPLLG